MWTVPPFCQIIREGKPSANCRVFRTGNESESLCVFGKCKRKVEASGQEEVDVPVGDFVSWEDGSVLGRVRGRRAERTPTRRLFVRRDRTRGGSDFRCGDVLPQSGSPSPGSRCELKDCPRCRVFDSSEGRLDTGTPAGTSRSLLGGPQGLHRGSGLGRGRGRRAQSRNGAESRGAGPAVRPDVSAPPRLPGSGQSPHRRRWHSDPALESGPSAEAAAAVSAG